MIRLAAKKSKNEDIMFIRAFYNILLQILQNRQSLTFLAYSSSVGFSLQPSLEYGKDTDRRIVLGSRLSNCEVHLFIQDEIYIVACSANCKIFRNYEYSPAITRWLGRFLNPYYEMATRWQSILDDTVGNVLTFAYERVRGFYKPKEVLSLLSKTIRSSLEAMYFGSSNFLVYSHYESIIDTFSRKNGRKCCLCSKKYKTDHHNHPDKILHFYECHSALDLMYTCEICGYDTKKLSDYKTHLAICGPDALNDMQIAYSQFILDGMADFQESRSRLFACYKESRPRTPIDMCVHRTAQILDPDVRQ